MKAFIRMCGIHPKECLGGRHAANCQIKKKSLKINNQRIHKRMLSNNVIKDGQFHF